MSTAQRVRTLRARWVLPTQRWLVLYLVFAGALLAFDSLYAYALEVNQHPSWAVADVIPTGTFLPRELLAFVWATVVEGLLAAGGLGIKHDKRDWRAWLLLTVGVPATLAFQVLHIWPIIGRAVPTLAWLLALIVLELPRGKAQASGQGRGKGALEGTPGAVPGRASAPGAALQGALTAPQGAPARAVPPPTPAQQAVIHPLHAQGASGRAIRTALAQAGHPIGDDKLRAYLRTLPEPDAAAVASNGGHLVGEGA